jgi:NADPH:quinone reductase-like Zn-dependent oxidoreductase
MILSCKILQMLAARIHPEGIKLEQLTQPTPGMGELLVRVHAAGLTRNELTWPVERLPAIPSYELSGVVAALGPDTEGFSEGDEVFGLTPFDRDGVAAEYAIVPAAVIAPKPRALTHVQSAAVTLAGLSAWQGLFEHGRLGRDERVRVLGERGGVGHLAVQLARSRLAGASESCDLIFDTVGGEALAQAIDSGARVVTVAEERPGADYFVVEPNRAELCELGRLADAGGLEPSIDSVFPLSDAVAAFARVAERGKRGKVVLGVTED